MKIEAGQVAVVTGGASGIGYALAGAFAARGLSVVLADVRPAPLDHAAGSLADTHAQALAAAGAAVVAVATDVSDPGAVQALADTTLERFGRVDVVCNNAGVVCRQAPMWEQTPQTWRWLTDVLLLGVANGVRSFAPSMIAQGGGHFLNTASVAGLMRFPGLGPYGTVKHAVVGLTETLDAELRVAAPGVGASVLCPGLVETSLVATSAAIRPDGAETAEPPSRLRRATLAPASPYRATCSPQPMSPRSRSPASRPTGCASSPTPTASGRHATGSPPSSPTWTGPPPPTAIQQSEPATSRRRARLSSLLPVACRSWQPRSTARRPIALALR